MPWRLCPSGPSPCPQETVEHTLSVPSHPAPSAKSRPRHAEPFKGLFAKIPSDMAVTKSRLIETRTRVSTSRQSSGNKMRSNVLLPRPTNILGGPEKSTDRYREEKGQCKTKARLLL